MKRPAFFISWILGALSMMGLSVLWHGVLLNDLIDIPYPLWLFLSLCGVVYLVVSFVLAFLLEYLRVREHHISKGAGIGGILGFFLYLIAFTMGVSFHGHGMEHIVVNFLWQMIEQGMGGGIVGLVFLLDHRRVRALGQDPFQNS